MDVEQVINHITPALYRRLKCALELGKWPDGRSLTERQRASCMEAIIAYEHRFVPESERTGFIDSPDSVDDTDADNDSSQPLKWD
jgi:uncharacterized protein YeaC (DUF1315 family)